MEKGNFCILLRQCLNKNISHLIVTHGLFFHRFPFAFVCLETSYLKKFENKLRPSSNTCETKTHQRKNTRTLRRKEKLEKFITAK